jgi:small subunit ribosomal protein S6
MREYELMIVMRPEIDPTDSKKVGNIVAKMLGSQAKTIITTEIIGKKRLAYIIQKCIEGIYVLVTLKTEHIEMQSVEKQVKLMPEIIRHLITVKE